MTDRHAIAYQLIANGLRRSGLRGTVDEVADALRRLPLSPATRFAIMMAGDGRPPPEVNERDVEVAFLDWRAQSLASNPFA